MLTHEGRLAIIVCTGILGAALLIFFGVTIIDARAELRILREHCGVGAAHNVRNLNPATR